MDGAQLDTDDAVTLFVERARAVVVHFELSDSDRVLLADLCKRLDGMPLAIELTAARNAFPVSQLSERLDDRFRLLTGGARTALPRQQTLRAVTDWSYELLFDHERAVFERLSVFNGGCTLEAAEAVCADDRIAADDVGDIIARLIDKSLLVREASGRYRLLLTLASTGVNDSPSTVRVWRYVTGMPPSTASFRSCRMAICGGGTNGRTSGGWGA